MARDKSLSPRAKEVIRNKMAENGEITQDEVMDLIRPHFVFDAHKEREKAIRRKANQFMAQHKDEYGVRRYLNCKLDEESFYVNIDTTSNLEALIIIEDDIRKKIVGLGATRKKVNQRRWEIAGQMSLFEDAVDF